MHTILRNPDKTWAVCRVTQWGVNGSVNPDFNVMFDKLSFGGALRLVNILNGGDRSVLTDIEVRALEGCAHG